MVDIDIDDVDYDELPDVAEDSSVNEEEGNDIELDDLQEDVKERVGHWGGTGTRVSTTNQFRELCGTIGNQEKASGKVNYLSRTIIKIWKGDSLKNKAKKQRYKMLVARSMKSVKDGKFDIARAQGRLLTGKRMKRPEMSEVNGYIHRELLKWYRALPQGHPCGRRMFYPQIRRILADWKKANPGKDAKTSGVRKKKQRQYLAKWARRSNVAFRVPNKKFKLTTSPS